MNLAAGVASIVASDGGSHATVIWRVCVYLPRTKLLISGTERNVSRTSVIETAEHDGGCRKTRTTRIESSLSSEFLLDLYHRWNHCLFSGKLICCDT